MSFDTLIERILKLENPTVAGLDARIEYIPEYLRAEAFAQYGETLQGAAEAILRFNKELIDALCDIVPAVKPQVAYYKLLGFEGVSVLADTICYAKSKGMYVIADAKRGDIGSTMDAYAESYLGTVTIGKHTYTPFGADAMTVNGYLGSDCINAALKTCKAHNKAIFVLAKTSNPSSGELQDKQIEGIPVYQLMGELCERWGEDTIGAFGYSAVGAVVGATYPEQIAALRKLLPHTFFLIPGYGAQGGKAADIVAAFDKNGVGGIVNSSRAIMCAYKKTGDERHFAAAAREEALRMRDELMGCIKQGK
jgi:orotidine-5'-phosphate decarboxylase